MELKIYQLLIDFGLVILIFLVQLCIYPAFKYFRKEDLLHWHKIYTPNITYIVLPLMLSQLIISTYFVYTEFHFRSGLHFTLILLSWISTFLFFVPIHQKINSNNHTFSDLQKLEKGNWFRLILWTLTFIITLTS